MGRIARVFLLSLSFSFSALASWAPQDVRAAETQRVALVDVQRCILETSEGKKGKRDLERVYTRNQAKLERKGKDLQKSVDDLRAKSAMLSAPELMRRQQSLQRKDAELQQLYQKLTEDLAQKEGLLTERIYRRVSTIVKQIALEDRIHVVLVRSQATVLYAKPALDLTNRVIVAYDKRHK
ncbi:MAG: OmpH family outer membrane protein [Nannocystaceae bacterium]